MSWNFYRRGPKEQVITALQSHSVAGGLNLNQFLDIREMVVAQIRGMQHEAGVEVDLAGHADEHHREFVCRVVGFHITTETGGHTIQAPEPDLPNAA